MNTVVVVVVCLLGLLPSCTTLNCYSCTGATASACNDPFSSSGSGISTTGAISVNSYCVKVLVGGVVTRSGSPACTTTSFVFNSGTACCQTDLCNGARGNYQSFVLLAFSLLIILVKVAWV